MSISNEQSQLIERLLNLPGVQDLGANITNEREVTIQVETDGDHAIRHNCGQEATEFYGYGVRLRLRHFQVFNRRVYLYLCPKRFSCVHCYGWPTKTRLDDWYDAQSGMTRAFAESLLMEIVGVASNDALAKHQISYDLLRGILKRYDMSGVEGLNGKAPTVISVVRGDRSHAGL
jgi:hypothetical protein